MIILLRIYNFFTKFNSTFTLPNVIFNMNKYREIISTKPDLHEKETKGAFVMEKFKNLMVDLVLVAVSLPLVFLIAMLVMQTFVWK